MVTYHPRERTEVAPDVSLPHLLRTVAGNLFLLAEGNSERVIAWATSAIPRRVQRHLQRVGNDWREKSQLLPSKILNCLKFSDHSETTRCRTTGIRVITVRSGDCLSEIARRTQVPVEVIQRLNRLEDIELLQRQRKNQLIELVSVAIGRLASVDYQFSWKDSSLQFRRWLLLRIQGKQFIIVQVECNGQLGLGGAVQGHFDGDRWIVANLGDSLWSLAATFHISVKDLKRANGMSKDSSVLMIGQKIRIPAARIPPNRPSPSLWPPSLSSLSSFELHSALLPLHFMLQPALLRNWPLFGRPEILRLLPVWKAESFGLPVKGGWLSSYYGWKDGRAYFHNGIDIACESGSEVRAATSGRITYSDWKGGYGKTVCIDHGNGLATLYAHNSDLRVRPGQLVRKGHLIALSGNTGFSTGPHLHFEIHKDGLTIDPLDVIPQVM